MRPLLRMLLLCVCIFTLHACSVFPLNRHSLPVEASQLGGGLAPGFELHAVLTVARDGIKQEYLMSLRTKQSAVRLALMTPQGLPVYVVSGSGGAIAVEKQLHSGHLLTPDRVACYLLMVYGDSELLAESAANHNWQTGGDARGAAFLPARRGISDH